jgi:hypothetical protein
LREGGKRTKAASGLHRFLVALDAFQHDTLGIGGIAPLADPHPLFRLRDPCSAEEVLDLLETIERQILALADIAE